jgi:hypothetical protein
MRLPTPRFKKANIEIRLHSSSIDAAEQSGDRQQVSAGDGSDTS